MTSPHRCGTSMVACSPWRRWPPNDVAVTGHNNVMPPATVPHSPPQQQQPRQLPDRTGTPWCGRQPWRRRRRAAGRRRPTRRHRWRWPAAEARRTARRSDEVAARAAHATRSSAPAVRPARRSRRTAGWSREAPEEGVGPSGEAAEVWTAGQRHLQWRGSSTADWSSQAQHLDIRCWSPMDRNTLHTTCANLILRRCCKRYCA